jgi:hypothetical protein
MSRPAGFPHSIFSGSQTRMRRCVSSVPRRPRRAGDAATAAPTLHLAGVLTRIDPAIAGTGNRSADPVSRGSPEAEDSTAVRVLGGASGPSSRRAHAHRLCLRRVPLRTAVVIIRGARDTAVVGHLTACPAASRARALAAILVRRGSAIAVLTIRVAHIAARGAVARRRARACAAGHAAGRTVGGCIEGAATRFGRYVHAASLPDIVGAVQLLTALR